ncbi:hypothetical protein QCA50_017775 [Cerrena zonata]|uniref:Uncharacterized protein n=1 Tax=Cerrena zonata TaxID=2478898 RepID=A0AAW0FPH6_9APHY
MSSVHTRKTASAMLQQAKKIATKRRKEKETMEKDMKNIYSQMANAAVESCIRPAVYNAYDLYNFAFEHNVATPCTPEELNLPLIWIYCMVDSAETEDDWIKRRHHKSGLSRDDFIYLSPYYPSSDSMSLDQAQFIPRRTYEVMEAVVNASNNVAIIHASLEHVSSPVNDEDAQQIRVLGWYFHQIVDFCMYACHFAWLSGTMTPTFVPFDLYEYMDLCYRANTHLGPALQKIGYQDRYEVPWSPSINLQSVQIVDRSHPLATMMFTNELHHCPFDVDNVHSWADFVAQSPDEIKTVYRHVIHYIRRSQKIVAGDIDIITECKTKFETVLDPPPPTRESLQARFMAEWLPMNPDILRVTDIYNKANAKVDALQAALQANKRKRLEKAGPSGSGSSGEHHNGTSQGAPLPAGLSGGNNDGGDGGDVGRGDGEDADSLIGGLELRATLL